MESPCLHHKRSASVFEPKPTVLVQMTGELAISKRVTLCVPSKKNEITFLWRLKHIVYDSILAICVKEILSNICLHCFGTEQTHFREHWISEISRLSE